ncbi:MAG: serine hydrolase domain-containing protein [Parafilimonas sp.]
MKSISFVFGFLLFAQTSFTQTWQDTLTIIDKTLSQYQPQNPGLQLSVSRNGAIVFSKAWGMADIERNVQLSTNSILEAGSVSKQFTAAAILLLQQQGKLSLDDDVRKYIPELPDYGTPITLRQMLHHTSGLRDWGSVADLTGWSRGKKFYTNDDALEILARQKHLNNKPGDEFLYSNSNYNLFAIIVQRVSGLSLAAFTHKYIFEPAGMAHTQWRDDPNRVVPNRAIAYSKTDSSYKTEMPNEYVYGNGGLLTTTEDLLKWNNFYQQGNLGTPSLLDEQIKTEPLNNGAMNIYGAGLFIRKDMGWNSISHNGATASYRAYLETFPDLNLSFALLSNTSQFNINYVARSITKIFVHDTSSATKDSSINLAAEQLNDFTGMYVNERDNSTFQLSVRNNSLMLNNQLPLAAVNENTFKAVNFLLQMKETKGSYIPLSPRDTIPFRKVDTVNVLPKDFHIYESNYFSEETNSTATILHDSSKLMIRLNADEIYQLIPTYADAFKIIELDCDVQFVKNTQGKIIMMKMNVSRARNVEFKKMK